jgi:hypothetical protein
MVEVPTSPGRVNEERMKVTNECETGSTNTGPHKCSGRAPLKRGADAREGTPQKDVRGTARPNEDVASETPEQRKNR